MKKYQDIKKGEYTCRGTQICVPIPLHRYTASQLRSATPADPLSSAQQQPATHSRSTAAMSQAPPATAGPAAASAAKGSAAAPSSEGGAPQDPAAAERSGSTEAAEEAVAEGKEGGAQPESAEGMGRDRWGRCGQRRLRGPRRCRRP